MSAAQHTPGPWVLDESDYIQARGFRIESANPEVGVIAYTHAVDSQCDGRYSIGEERANARLIAAAPELLAIVKYMLGYVQSDIDDLKTKGMDPADQTLYLFEKARAAIAKAKGGAS
jgi:hypothetical protein